MFPSVEFPKICWTIKHICALPSALIKKIHKDQFEIDEENTKLQIARKLPLKPQFFFQLLMICRKNFTNCENFGQFHRSKLKKIKGKVKLSLASASLHRALT